MAQATSTITSMLNARRLKNVALNCMKSSHRIPQLMKLAIRPAALLCRAGEVRPGAAKGPAIEPELYFSQSQERFVGRSRFAYRVNDYKILSMRLPFRILNWVFLIVSAILEIIAIYFMVEVLYSHCVRGGEYGPSIWFFVCITPVIALHTLCLVIFRIFCRTTGLDPTAVVFNIISGLLLIIATLILLIAMADHCGNIDRNSFFAAGSLGLVAGVLHFVNGIICLVYIPPEEARYMKPGRLKT